MNQSSQSSTVLDNTQRKGSLSYWFRIYPMSLICLCSIRRDKRSSVMLPQPFVTERSVIFCDIAPPRESVLPTQQQKPQHGMCRKRG
ncbi:hypothetical protein JTE90_010688 [Oedothorax gibbosus]|uniref:Uncharacterized protein n=1 Tax=Oedothorax gibbosus TaxID=931172 RepID=A0AAV6URG9_9ARAC|nr:hypothetical protein JTE90_010688 [Oedothorax gibbosus]